MRPLIIDVHVHTSDNTMRGLHTTDASLLAIEHSATELGIEQALVLATYFPFKKRGLHNQELLARLGGFSRFKAIGSLDAMNALGPGIRELEALARHGQIVGIKLYPGYQNIHLNSQDVALVLDLARIYALPVTIHAGALHHCCSARRRENGDLRCGNTFCWIDKLGYLAHPDAMRASIQAYPEITFVIAHMANPYFDALRSLMREFPNVVTDISGQFISGTHEDSPEYRQRILHEIECFLTEVPDGRERVLFGSDFPIQSFVDSIWLVENLNTDETTRNAIFRTNALRVYPTLTQPRTP